MVVKYAWVRRVQALTIWCMKDDRLLECKSCSNLDLRFVASRQKHDEYVGLAHGRELAGIVSCFVS